MSSKTVPEILFRSISGSGSFGLFRRGGIRVMAEMRGTGLIVLSNSGGEKTPSYVTEVA